MVVQLKVVGSCDLSRSFAYSTLPISFPLCFLSFKPLTDPKVFVLVEKDNAGTVTHSCHDLALFFSCRFSGKMFKKKKKKKSWLLMRLILSGFSCCFIFVFWTLDFFLSSSVKHSQTKMATNLDLSWNCFGS